MQSDLEKLDDAGTDVMMAVDGKLMVLIGEAFVEVDEDAATAHIDKKTEVSGADDRRLQLISSCL